MVVPRSASAPGPLRSWFDRVEVDEMSADQRTFVRVPDTATALVFRTTAEHRSDLFVVGPRTRGSYHPAKSLPVCIRMRVRPAWSRALLGVDVRDLVDRAIPLSDLWGADADRLVSEMADAGDRVFARLASALREHAGAHPVSPARSRLLTSAMNALAPAPVVDLGGAPAAGLGDASVVRLGGAPAADLGGAPVARLGGAPAVGLRRVPVVRPDGAPAVGLGSVSAGLGAVSGMRFGVGQDGVSVVAERLGVSERHLRNVFRSELGISPKHFARIARLRRVLSLAGRRQWANVAGDAGFFDQAHMITDFRALMGVSPGAYLAGRLPTPSACS